MIVLDKVAGIFSFSILGNRICAVSYTHLVKGFVSDVMVQEGLTNLPYFACGPMPMLKAVWRTSNAPGQLSFEERMGCGFGACMGCSCETISGPKRICKEGPVLSSQEVLWTKD